MVAAASVAGELPELIGALHRPLGEIVDIKINWSPTDAAPDLDSASSSSPWTTSQRLPRGAFTPLGNVTDVFLLRRIAGGGGSLRTSGYFGLSGDLVAFLVPSRRSP